MKIKQKLLLGAAGLSLVPLALMAGLLWQGATSLSGQTIDEQVRTQLSSLRDTKVAQVRDEVHGRVAALRALGANRVTAEALSRLKAGFDAAGREEASADPASQKQALLAYVSRDFGGEFAKRNPSKAPELSAIVDGLSPQALRLQYDYIAANTHKLGEKYKLQAAPGAANYHAVHAVYHATFERAQQLLGFYDIFLIDTATDQVVYTVFKELDFGTRLTDGIAAKTKLAEAYQRVKNAKSRDEFYLSDFEPYLPSYNDQAAFAAVPIFEGDKQIGVLAIQYPINKLNQAMSSGNNWSKIGLGQTGDSFIVGQDFVMRSDARYQLEESHRAGFAEQLAGKLSPEKLALMKAKNSTIGLVRAESDATRAAREGKSGTLRYVDHRGVESIGAFGPLQVAGQNWLVVAAIDAAEADAPLQALSRNTLQRSGAVALGVLALVGGLMVVFLRRFMQPIEQLHGAVNAVAAGQSKARSQLVQADEIGELGRAFDKLLDERIAAQEKAEAENEQLNNSVIALLQTVFQLSNRDLTARADVTEDVIGTLSSSINQLSDATGTTLAQVRDIAEQVRQASEHARLQADHVGATAQGERQALASMSTDLARAVKQLVKVAQLSDNSSKAAERASTATEGALRAVSATVRGMDELRDSISETEKRFKRLGERSQEISSVVSLINTISERTHMLAMNASMQAATAGEAGRGFAVVAEEVQRLSESSRQATQQISQLVQNIQIETNETLYTMNRLISQVVAQSAQAQQAGEQMTQTQETTSQLVDLVKQIAIFSDQQSLLARELQLSVVKLNKGSEQTVTAIDEQSRSTTTLVDYSRQLAEAVGQFKLPEPA